jgi:hypothetical protein
MSCRLAVAPNVVGVVEKLEISRRAHSTMALGIGGANAMSARLPEGERVIVK